MIETPLPPRTATFAARPCLCCIGHTPVPLEVELHHVLPQTYQRALWGAVREPKTIPMCRTAHRNLHIVLSALLAGKPTPRVNSYTAAWAHQGFRMIEAAYKEAGRPMPTDGRGE